MFCGLYKEGEIVNQCEIPSCGAELITKEETDNYHIAIGKIDTIGINFIKIHSEYNHFSTEEKLYGKPSQLNRNNDCYFYNPKPKFKLTFWQKINKFLDKFAS